MIKIAHKVTLSYTYSIFYTHHYYPYRGLQVIYIKINKFPQSWLNEISTMVARQMLVEVLETEALNMTKVDHPAYFRRRFLKSRVISEEVNELRSEESSSKNQSFVEKMYGADVLDK
jgi:hypothetical protein